MSPLPDDVAELLKVDDDLGILNASHDQEGKSKIAGEINTITNRKEKGET